MELKALPKRICVHTWGQQMDGDAIGTGEVVLERRPIRSSSQAGVEHPFKKSVIDYTQDFLRTVLRPDHSFVHQMLANTRYRGTLGKGETKKEPVDSAVRHS